MAGTIKEVFDASASGWGDQKKEKGQWVAGMYDQKKKSFSIYSSSSMGLE